MARRPAAATPGLTRKQLSRAQREARFRRIVLILTGIVVVAVLGLAAYGIANEQFIRPNKVLATVNDETITVSEFEDRVKFESFMYQFNPMAQYQPFDPVQADILNIMVEEIVIQQKAEEMNISISEEEVRERSELAFGYDAGDPEPTPTPYPTDPTPEGDATATPTFVYTLTPAPTATLEPGVTPTETEEPTSTPDEPPTATPTGTPAPTPTPISEEDYTTRFNEIFDEAATLIGMEPERVHEMWYERVRIEMFREELRNALEYDIDQTQTVAHIARILVATEEEAKAAQERIDSGEEFAEVAAEISLDTFTAYKGGDMGWASEDQIDPALAEAAFSNPVDTLSEPIETSEGWNLIFIYDRQDQPTTFFDQESQRYQLFEDRVDEWVEEADVEIDESYVEYIPELP